MSTTLKHSRIRFLALAVPVAFMTACVEYRIDTTVNADGSGLRVEVIEAEENDDVSITSEVFPKIMHTTVRDGWSHTTKVDSDGDTIHAFRRRNEVRDLAGWSQLTGTIRISGAVPEKARARVGYVTYGDVRFHNTLRLQRAADSDGKVSFTYNETFVWDRAVDALLEFLTDDLDRRMAAQFPGVPSRDRAQIVGFARALLWTAVEEGLLSGDGDEDRHLRAVVRSTADHFLKRFPDTAEEPLLEVLRQSLVDVDERLEGFLEEELPGLNIALNSEIVFRLNMPGEVTNSNAHKRDGSTLVWEFGPADAFHTPIEIVAESVVGG